jgi:hypothetical protein
MMDRDYPISRRAAIATVVALSVSGAFGFLLFSGAIPGLKPDYTPAATVSVDGHPYYWEDYTLPFPLPPYNTTAPSVVEFHNASFGLWVTNWYSVTGGLVHGNVTEPNGTLDRFALGEPPGTDQPVTLYVSADSEVGAEWHEQPFVELLVLAPSGP